MSPKKFMLFFHVPEFCEKKNMGLDPCSEQTAESLHHDFKTVWKNVEVRDLNYPEFGEKLLKAVIMYNSQHLYISLYMYVNLSFASN